MIIYDSPIVKIEDDKLNRGKFAKNLSVALCETDVPVGLNVAVYGSWGSGKTSIVNMMIKYIKEKYEQKIVFVHFNPWYYASTDQLIQLFFESLSKQIADSKLTAVNELSKALGDYAALSGVVSDKAKTIFEFLKKRVDRENIFDSSDIMKQHTKIEEILRGVDFKIIVIMDDIDRLPDNDIKMIFQLITAVARFPNIIYLLAFDKDVVSVALNNMQGCNGEKYLEKIIQVPVQIPDIRTLDLWNLLEIGLKDLLQTYTNIIVEEKHLQQVLSFCVPRYINNLRDIIRLSNALDIKMRMVGDDINFPDMLGITVIENKFPELYRWIKNNRDLLVSSVISDIYFESYHTAEIHKMYLNAISDISRDDAEDVLAFLCCLFPVVDKRCNILPIHDVDMQQLRRIGDARMFNRYFVLDIESQELSRKELQQLLGWETIDCLSKVLCQLKKQDKLLEFLLEIDDYSLSKEKIPTIVEGLLKNHELFISDQGDNCMSNPFKPNLEIIYYLKCNKLINNIIDSDKREELSQNMKELLGEKYDLLT